MHYVTQHFPLINLYLKYLSLYNPFLISICQQHLLGIIGIYLFIVSSHLLGILVTNFNLADIIISIGDHGVCE